MKVYVMLADGFEETEALVPWDVLKRAGAEVKLVSVSASKRVTGAHGLAVEADAVIDGIGPSIPDCIVLPGGMPGTLNLKACAKLSAMLLEADSKGGVIAAICAAPSVLGGLGLLKGKKAVCFPGFENTLDGATVVDTAVCRDGRIITAKGMGAAFEFAFALTDLFFGNETAAQLKKGVQYN
ncbi:MAG: DJ-1/PfpI family protein [Clostridia bacterium]|nr:DJ-1/PfpI family protein [Clostridia bacterium]